MGGGLFGDMKRERAIVAWLFLGGIALVLAGVDATNLLDCRAEMTDDEISWGEECSEDTERVLGLALLIGGLCVITSMLIIQFSVLRTTGSNGEWLWFAFSLTGSAAPLYYVLDWLGTDLVEGADGAN